MSVLVGIDKIAWHVPKFYVDLNELAEHRGFEKSKLNHLGQSYMSVVLPQHDIVTMAYDAASQILTDEDKSAITTILFATETGMDCSKSSGLALHRLLGISKYCRILELKQACYSAVGGLLFAMDRLRANTGEKILLIASDIARYDMYTSAETSQGAGCCAMLLTADPKFLVIDPNSSAASIDCYDFWRPLSSRTAKVNGSLSIKTYMKLLDDVWQNYYNLYGVDLSDFHYFCYHTPYPRLVEKAHYFLKDHYNVFDIENWSAKIKPGLCYSKLIGNCYTASIFLSLLSLANNQKNLSGAKVGFYSYGSGACAEFFTGSFTDTYMNCVSAFSIAKRLDSRQKMSVEDYERIHSGKNVELSDDIYIEMRCDSEGRYTYILNPEFEHRDKIEIVD